MKNRTYYLGIKALTNGATYYNGKEFIYNIGTRTEIPNAPKHNSGICGENRIHLHRQLSTEYSYPGCRIYLAKYTNNDIIAQDEYKVSVRGCTLELIPYQLIQQLLRLGFGKNKRLNYLWLYHADLTGADLTEANLTGADLTEADLYRANLTEANLLEADLYRANLTGANLTGADLTEANLTEANLTGANLYRANLTGANLTGADLTGANLIDANLIDANLIDAVLPQTFTQEK